MHASVFLIIQYVKNTEVKKLTKLAKTFKAKAKKHVCDKTFRDSAYSYNVTFPKGVYNSLESVP